jgi:N-acetylglucosamine-6-phosphate deacetylase
MHGIARHYQTGGWVSWTTDGMTLTAVEAAEGPDVPGEDDEWIAPAFWDIQTNGRWGISFSDPELTVDDVIAIVRVQAELGTARLCPTLITAGRAEMLHGVRTIAAACAEEPAVAAAVAGIHVEGPYISEVDGYRGAHPLGAVRDPDWGEFQALQDAAEGRIVLITLAPERPGAIAFIEKAVLSGVVVSLGHTAADGDTLRAAAAAGARLSTHLGNGIAATLARHPNPIWDQAALDYLSASFIADGHHIGRSLLRVLARAKGLGRAILVSDASPLAGLPPGQYGPWAVDPGGKIVVAGTPYLAGSNQNLDVGLNNLLEATDCSLGEALETVTGNPARLLGSPAPALEPGRPASMIGFRRPKRGHRPGFELRWTCVDGVKTVAGAGARTPQPAN